MDKKNNDDIKTVCRALINTKTDDNSDYDFECVATPVQNSQTRFNWEKDEYFEQILKVGTENIDVSRLQSGLPLFDNHTWDKSASETLGITTDYIIDERGLVVRVKLGARADEALRSDIKNGIIKTVSIEGCVNRYSVQRNFNEIPKYYAELWTPESLSFAPVPNDIGAQIEVQRKIQRQLAGVDESQINKLITKF